MGGLRTAKAKFCAQCGVPVFEAASLCDNCTKLQHAPDPLSKQKHLAGVPFDDLKQVAENDRIKTIVGALRINPGKTFGMLVDHGPAYQGKGDRYIEKIRALLPAVKVVKRFLGPTEGCETITLQYE